MIVLGIETSCDETAIAVVKGGNEILSNIIYSQKEHAGWGGVVPEFASREHIRVIHQVLKEALEEAKVSLEMIDLIAVTEGPGLTGSLLVGIDFAKGLAFSLNKPLMGVNHLHAHLHAPFMFHEIPLPALGVLISGGHTALVLIPNLGEYHLVGETRDDAVGEAFDKVASLLDLPYPGGPLIEQLAKKGNPHRYALSAGKIEGEPYAFSFSGLKTKVLYLVKGQNGRKEDPLLIAESDKPDLAASFQRAAFTDIVAKSLSAAKEYGCKSLLFGGGVSANQCLKGMMEEHKGEYQLFFPPKALSLDNGAMIAALATLLYKRGHAKHAVKAYSRHPWHALSSV